jgi:hypothetical protein
MYNRIPMHLKRLMLYCRSFSCLLDIWKIVLDCINGLYTVVPTLTLPEKVTSIVSFCHISEVKNIRSGSCKPKRKFFSPKYGLSCSTTCIKIAHCIAYAFQSYWPGHKLWLMDSLVWERDANCNFVSDKECKIFLKH